MHLMNSFTIKRKKESASKSTSRFQVFISSAFILHNNGIQKKKQKKQNRKITKINMHFYKQPVTSI